MAVRFVPVESSQISKVGCDLDAAPDQDCMTWNLYVEFKTGAVYKYADVPAQIVTEVVFAGSVGSAFNALVKKGGFQYRQVQGAAK